MQSLSSPHNQMNFCLQIINYSKSFLLQLCGCFLWEGGSAHFIFLMYALKNGDKNKAFGTFSGSVCSKLNTKGRQMQ
jgi:hypothetical protein